MSAEIKEKYPDAEVVLKASAGGVFEVTVDGKDVFSKKALGRFPEPGEVVGKV